MNGRYFVAWPILLIFSLVIASVAQGATEQQKRQAIDDGLAWLASTQIPSGSEGYWSYSDSTGVLATTASAALAFIEEGYLPNDGSIYGDVVAKAFNYIMNRATVDTRFGVETAVYTRYAEDYNNNGIFGDDGGNDQAIYFEPGASARRVYTTGMVAPVVHALGEALGRDTVIGGTNPVVSSMTYRQLMQDIVDWFSWGQVEPNLGNYRGGWRYDANYSSSDNSTAQWGALPLLYGQTWGLGTPQFVYDELALWVAYIQNPNGGSGYSTPYNYVNVSKTGGLLLEFAALGYGLGDANVQAALTFINTRWNNGPYSTWYGNINHPYAMWAVYKALQVYGFMETHDNDTPLVSLDDFLIGTDFVPPPGISVVPVGFTIGQDWDPKTSVTGDWYSHYSDVLVSLQNADGSWNGYSYWTGALATGWYINILNARGVVELERFEKEITAGPDEDGDGVIDAVVETVKPVPTFYEFTIHYADIDRPDHVVVLDTVPAEWEVLYAEPSELADFVEFFPANEKQPGKCATKIVWRPATVSSSLAVGVLSRERPSKKEPKFAPTSCGALFLNDGAAAFVADPATGMPLEDPATGEPFPPIFGPTAPLCLAAVCDFNEDGIIVFNGSGDEDGDGLTDLREACELGTSPCDPDTDGDGLLDPEELELGTDPLLPDTDGDGFSDGEEVLMGTDPLDENDPPPLLP